MSNQIEQFLHKPIRPYIVTQKFGSMGACVDVATGFKVVNSVNGKCPAGYRSLYGPGGHGGLDLQAKRGTPIYASQNGWVFAIQTEPAFGVEVSIITDAKYYFRETDSFEYAKYRNCHMLGINVKKGQKIMTGDLLGWVDSTGLSSGDHDHIDLKPVAKNSEGEYYNILQNNGTFGAVDPEPYMSELYALDVRGMLSALSKIREQLAALADAIAEYLRRR